MIKVCVCENYGVQILRRDVYWKTDFMIDHDPIVHQNLATGGLDGDGRPSYFLACS